MKIKKKLLNKVVMVDFYDHTMGDINLKPERCTIFGRLITIESKHIVIQFWESKDSDDDTEAFAILTSTIEAITELS